ncbi:MAG: hypothetical protein ACR2OM_13215 [Aestuariivirgaceae bacterium]
MPVVHVLDIEQSAGNIRIATGEGAPGVFLINHDFDKAKLIPIVQEIRGRFPALWLGVNFLAVTGRDAFPVLGRLEKQGCTVDAYWADDARIDERRAEDDQPEAAEIARVRAESGWSGLYFGGTAFKKQRAVDADAYETAARLAVPFMDVVTTSGKATGHEAARSKVKAFRRGVADKALALASGITPDNAGSFADVDCFMVATGINVDGDFYNIAPAKLARLMKVSRMLAEGANG